MAESHPPNTRRHNKHWLRGGTWRVFVPVPEMAGAGHGIVAGAGPTHHADDDRQDVMVETAAIGGEGTGMADASAVFAILDVAPAIGAGTQGAGQHLDMIDKKPVFLLEPPESGPGRTVGISERNIAP